jgi:hypothetical protein
MNLSVELQKVPDSMGGDSVGLGFKSQRSTHRSSWPAAVMQNAGSG